MTQELLNKIINDYYSAKNEAEQYVAQEVIYNTGGSLKDITDEYAKQVNITNKFRKKEADLYFLLSLLQEAQSIQTSVPKGVASQRQINNWIDVIKALLKVYSLIGQIQSTIIRYYEKGGGSF